MWRMNSESLLSEMDYSVEVLQYDRKEMKSKFQVCF